MTGGRRKISAMKILLKTGRILPFHESKKVVEIQDVFFGDVFPMTENLQGWQDFGSVAICCRLVEPIPPSKVARFLIWGYFHGK
jgi:hypothetical protein